MLCIDSERFEWNFIINLPLFFLALSLYLSLSWDNLLHLFAPSLSQSNDNLMTYIDWSSMMIPVSSNGLHTARGYWHHLHLAPWLSLTLRTHTSDGFALFSVSLNLIFFSFSLHRFIVNFQVYTLIIAIFLSSLSSSFSCSNKLFLCFSSFLR